MKKYYLIISIFILIANLPSNSYAQNKTKLEKNNLSKQLSFNKKDTRKVIAKGMKLGICNRSKIYNRWKR